MAVPSSSASSGSSPLLPLRSDAPIPQGLAELGPHRVQLFPASNPGQVVKASADSDVVDVEPQSADPQIIELSTFTLVPGLANGKDRSLVSILSYLDKNPSYLRHQDFVIKRHPYFDGDGYRSDASFLARSGLSDPTLLSFESANTPGSFISVVGHQLKIVAHPLPARATFKLVPVHDVPPLPPVQEIFPGTTILPDDKPQFAAQLNKWAGKSIDQSWKLLFKGTKDSFDANTFFANCANKGPTYIIVKVGDNIFGGFNATFWHSERGNSSSPGSFLYSLVNPHGVPPTLCPSKDPEDPYEITTEAPRQGPTFGAGFDLLLWTDCNENAKSYANIPTTYLDPSGFGDKFFTGTQNWTVTDYEAFGL